jgi:RHS repeat-associated protein
VTYTYDTNGNRLTGNPDAQDRVLSQGNTAYVYDNHGNVTTRTVTPQPAQTLTWNGQGGLLSVVQSGSPTVTYVIDPQGRRVGRKVGANVDREWLYDTQLRLVGEVIGSTSRVYGYLPERHLPVMMRETKGGNTTTYRIYGDHLGSLRAVVKSADGTPVQLMQHDAWGNVLMDTVAAGFDRVPFGFAGGQYDENTKLVRFGAREYDATTGRWLSKDEARFGGGWNFYEYAGSDPVNYGDWLGHMKLPATPAGLGPEWTLDPSHKAPNGERWRHPSGAYVDFHPARPGEGGDQERDHWHHGRQGNKDRNGKKKEKKLFPGDDIPDPEPVCEDPTMSGGPVDPNPDPEPCGDEYAAHEPYWLVLLLPAAVGMCPEAAGAAAAAEGAAAEGASFGEAAAAY